MPEFVVSVHDNSDVRQRKVAHAVRKTMRESHTATTHSVFAPPALSSVHTHIAHELLEQIQASDSEQAIVSLPLAGNGIVVDLRMHRRLAEDATHAVYVVHMSERMLSYVHTQPPAASVKRAHSSME